MFEHSDEEIVGTVSWEELRGASRAPTSVGPKYFAVDPGGGTASPGIPLLGGWRKVRGIRILPQREQTIEVHSGSAVWRIRYRCPPGAEQEVACRLSRARDAAHFVSTFFETWLSENTGSGWDGDPSRLARQLAGDCRRWLGLEADLDLGSATQRPGAGSARQEAASTTAAPEETAEVRGGGPPRSARPFAGGNAGPSREPQRDPPRESPRDPPSGYPPPGERGSRTNQLEVRIPDLVVRTRDSDLARNLDIAAEVECFPAGLFSANRNAEATLRELIIREIRYFCANSVSFHQLHFELRTEVRKRISSHLDHEIRKSGNGSLLGLRLAFAAGDQEPATIGENEQHELEIHFSLPREHGTEILIRHRLELRLVDLGRYVVSGIADFSSWLDTRLGAATRGVLFDMSYAEIITEFLRVDHQRIKEIRRRVEAELSSAGFEIQHLVLMPELPPLYWRAGVDLGAQGEKFLTQDRRVSFALELKASGRIPDPLNDRLKAYLSPAKAKEFPRLVRAKVIEELQREFDKVSPEQAYLRFDELRERLTALAKSVLVEQFAFEDPLVSLLPLESELTCLVDAICQETFKAAVEVPCLSEGAQSVPVKILVSFEILGVDEKGWSTFKIRNFSNAEAAKKKIQSYFEDALRASLKTLPGHLVRYTDARARTELRALVEPAVMQVSSVFGLILNVSNIDREFATTEKSRREEEVARLESERDLLVKEKRQLLEQLPDPNDEQVRRLEQKIKSLSKEIGELVAQIGVEKTKVEAAREMPPLPSGLPREQNEAAAVEGEMRESANDEEKGLVLRSSADPDEGVMS